MQDYEKVILIETLNILALVLLVTMAVQSAISIQPLDLCSCNCFCVQILMNVSRKKTCATLMQPVKIQMAVMSVLATVDFKEMALPIVQVSFCSSMFHDYVVYSFSNESHTGF